MLREQLSRTPFEAPRLLSDRIPDFAATGRYEPEWLERVERAISRCKGYAPRAAHGADGGVESPRCARPLAGRCRGPAKRLRAAPDSV